MRHLKRRFKCTDAIMLKTSSVLQKIFTDNLSDFTAMDTQLDMNYANQWQQKIKEAYTVERHSLLKDIQAHKTDIIKKLMIDCKDKYKEVKFFAFKAFEINDKNREKFGTKTFGKAKLQTTSMFVFMDELYETSITNQAALTNQGMSMASIQAIATLREQLLNAYTDRESYRKLKKTLTYSRIKLLNECYTYARTVCDAAMLIYRKDFARRKAFVFYTRKSGIGL